MTTNTPAVNSANNLASNADNFIPVHTQIWANGRHEMRCVKVIDETRDVKTFCFTATQPLMFFFKPGQFVTLELEIDGETVMRSYTISSSPSIPYSFSITVKRAPGGQVSNWLHDNMCEGCELAVHGPVGLFNCIDFPARKVLLLSGGVGITPLMSMARWWFDTNAEVDIAFVHSARTPADVVYKRELEHMASRVANFSLHLICETIENGQAWYGYRGYLDQSKIDIIAPDFLEREVFCCGPTPYMDAVRALLERNGFDMRHYHEEAFTQAPAKDVEQALEQADIAAEEAEALLSEDMLQVEFANAGKSVRLAPGETLHAAAANLGVNIPKACGMGICGTCKVMVKQGEVSMNHNGGITDEDIAAGYVLSCCSVPETDVVVEY